MPRTRHALIFDEAPTLYARYRPGYPPQAIDDLLTIGGVPAGAEVLEIGAGTGQLTVPLLDRGNRVTALEPGPRMAALLRRAVASYPGVRVIGARFEDAPIDTGTFDAVVAGTSFHWVDPDRRMPLAAWALRPAGVLALLRNEQVAGPDSEAYHRLAHEVYAREAPGIARDAGSPTEARAQWFGPEIVASARFELLDERRYRWTKTYDSRALVGMLRTFSDHRALPPGRRARLFRGLASVVDGQLGGSFTENHLTTLSVARRR